MERITFDWTPTLQQAFGDSASIRKGVEAELVFYQYAKDRFDDVEYFHDDQDKQIQGIDFRIVDPKSNTTLLIDVKGNLRPDGIFYIENDYRGWLRNPTKKTNSICHICVERRRGIIYSRYRMIGYMDMFPRKLIDVSVNDKHIRDFSQEFVID